MTDENLSRTLTLLADEAVARHLPPPSGALLAREAARRGERRLRRRAGIRVVAGAAAVCAVAGLAAVPGYYRDPGRWHSVPAELAQRIRGEHGSGRDPYGRFLEGRTRGPLAGDEDVLDRVRRAWRAGAGTAENGAAGMADDLRGEPHVVWAGRTPDGGIAAVVVQRAVLHRGGAYESEDLGARTLIGYLAGSADGAPRVMAADYGRRTLPPTGQMFAGWTDRPGRVLVALDPGYPMAVSTEWLYEPNGEARRSWTPIEFADGAAVVHLPDDVDPDVVRIARLPVEAVESFTFIGGRHWRPFPAQVQGEWQERVPCRSLVAEITRCGDENLVLQIARDRRTGPGLAISWPDDTVTGPTPDGRTFVVARHRLDGDPARVLGLVHGPGGADGTEKMVDAGPFDPGAAIPYAVRLPDGQGWLVARHGAGFRYRLSPGDPWRDTRRDAALLPDADSLQVEATPAGGSPEVVRLGG